MGHIIIHEDIRNYFELKMKTQNIKMCGMQIKQYIENNLYLKCSYQKRGKFLKQQSKLLSQDIRRTKKIATINEK